MALTNNRNEYKKVYSSFNIISDPRNTIKTESINSNSITDKNVKYDKLLLENNNKLFSVLKTLNEKIYEIIRWLNSKNSNKIEYNNNNDTKQLFYYQLFLFQKKISIFQEALLLYFEKLIEDLDNSQKDKSINLFGPNLNKFYNDIIYINDFLIQKINNKKINKRNNIECEEQFLISKSVTHKNYTSRSNKLPLLNSKRNENSINTNNIYYSDNIIDETEEDINLDYQNALASKEIINKEENQKNIKKLIFLKEKEIKKNINKEIINQDSNNSISNIFDKNKNSIFLNFHLKNKNYMSDKNIYNNKKAKSEKNYSTEKKEYKNEENISNISNEDEIDKEEEKNIYNIKIGKMTFADFFRNIYRKKKRKTFRNKADFII